MLDDILSVLGRPRSMSSFWLFVQLFRIYLPLELVCLSIISLDILISCTCSSYDANDRFMDISGLAGLQCSYLIAFKQLVPEHTVTLFRSPLKIRVKVRHFNDFLTIAFPRIIFICGSLVCTIYWSLCILITGPYRLFSILDISPFL
jgi:hypothetical protein